MREDLNFTLFSKEVWGPSVKFDPLGYYFRDFIKDNGLIGIDPIEPIPI